MPVALITGGEGDLAQAISQELMAQGYVVRAPGRGEMDVTDAASVAGCIGGLPALDLLICNAGLVLDESAVKMTEENFSRVLDVCLKGAFLCSREALEKMSRQRSGHIVFIGSYSALRGPAGQGNYAAAKAGMIALMQSLATEYGGRNIRVNCILPGFMETRMTAHLTEEAKDAFRQAHALGRFNTVMEVARFVAFLDASLPHTSGQIFNLDSRRHRWT